MLVLVVPPFELSDVPDVSERDVCVSADGDRRRCAVVLMTIVSTQPLLRVPTFGASFSRFSTSNLLSPLRNPTFPLVTAVSEDDFTAAVAVERDDETVFTSPNAAGDEHFLAESVGKMKAPSAG